MAVKAIHDHYILGGTDSKGNIKQVWGGDALKNAIKVWLSISQGEILRDPTSGGFLVSLLTKPMSEYNRDMIQKELYRGLVEEFVPNLQQIDIKVTPDYTKKQWYIEINASCFDIKDSIDLQLSVKNLV